MNIQKIIHNKKKFLIELVSVNLIIAAALMLRSYQIDTRPGYEWDEPVYAYIANHFSDNGFPTMLVEGGGGNEPYLYHPPFDFALKNLFFKVIGIDGITGARILSVLASGVSLVFIYHLINKVANKQSSLVTVLLLSTDGWLIYTNRLNLIENIMIPMGVVALAMYYYALNNKNELWFALSGVLLAFTAIYKHTGLYFLGIPILYLFFTKKHAKNHIVLYISATLAIITYVIAMYTRWGDLYLNQSLVQIKRALGIYSSRGLNYSFGDALNALFSTYWLYITTILSLLTGTVLVIKNTFNYVRTKQPLEQPLLHSWALASIIFFGALSLKSPQYLIMVLIPLYTYLTVQIMPILLKRKYRKLKYLSLGIILVLNAFTYYARFIQHNDNALLAVYDYANSTIPANSIVLTDESIGVGIRQKYYKIDLHNTAEEINKIKPNYVIIYLSTTQKLPRSQALEQLIQDSKLLQEFDGFKERVLVYRI